MSRYCIKSVTRNSDPAAISNKISLLFYTEKCLKGRNCLQKNDCGIKICVQNLDNCAKLCPMDIVL